MRQKSISWIFWKAGTKDWIPIRRVTGYPRVAYISSTEHPWFDRSGDLGVAMGSSWIQTCIATVLNCMALALWRRHSGHLKEQIFLAEFCEDFRIIFYCGEAKYFEIVSSIGRSFEGSLNCGYAGWSLSTYLSSSDKGLPTLTTHADPDSQQECSWLGWKSSSIGFCILVFESGTCSRWTSVSRALEVRSSSKTGTAAELIDQGGRTQGP